MISRPLTVPFVMVTCRCGRVLRAKSNQVGTEIRCWDCHQSMVVEIPKAQQRIVGQCARCSAELFFGAESQSLVSMACLMTAAFLVPYAGLGVVALLAIAGAAVYGELIGAEDRTRPWNRPSWASIRQARWYQRLGQVGFAAGTVVPLWFINAGLHRSPHLTRWTGPILLACWLLLPILLAGAHAIPLNPQARVRSRFDFVWVRPISTAWIVLVPLLALIAFEAALGGVFYASGSLPFFALDFMPFPPSIHLENQMPMSGEVNYWYLPSKLFTDGYLAGLRQGYTFTAAIPPSMSLPTSANVNPVMISLYPTGYYLYRMGILFFLSLTFLTSFVFQARCLNVLVNARRHYVT